MIGGNGNTGKNREGAVHETNEIAPIAQNIEILQSV